MIGRQNRPFYYIMFQTTRVLGPTGAEYLFFIFSGLVQCISLTTGNRVLRAENPLKPSGV